MIYLAIVLSVILGFIYIAWLAIRSPFGRLFIALFGLALVLGVGYVTVILTTYPRNVERGRREMALVSRQLVGKTRPEAYAILRQHDLVAYSVAYRVFVGDGRWPEPMKDYNGVVEYPDVDVRYTLGNRILCAEYGGQHIAFVRERVVSVTNNEFSCVP